MIVRILGEGQWVLDPDVLLTFHALDERVENAVALNDQQELSRVLADLLHAVREHGSELPDDMLAESDLVLPGNDATIDEVRVLLDETSDYYGLLPDPDEGSTA